MAGCKKSGPLCSYSNSENIEDGTLSRTQTPPPAAAGTLPGGRRPVGGQYAFLDGGKCLLAAYARAVHLSPSAIYHETGYQLGELLKGLVPGLLTMLGALGGTTAAGAGIGATVGFFAGGVGLVPGAAVGGQLGFDAGLAILSWLGLAFLLEAIGSGLGEMTAVLSHGVQRAWNAAQYRGTERDREIESAAEELAKAVGILVRLLLQGIVAYLLKNAALASTRGAIGTVKAVQGVGVDMVAQEAVSGLVSKLRASQLGDGFATWVERNWKDLVKNPRLRPKPAAVLRDGPSPSASTPGPTTPEGRGTAPGSSQSKPSDTTVLGHYPRYITLADELKANRFEIPESVWSEMTPAERWAANCQYLDQAIARGDKFVLATPIENVRPGSYFERELEYLYARGYRLSEDGSTMIRKP